MFTNASTTAAEATMREVRALGEDERFQRMNALEALWNGDHYALDGRKSFWDATVPLRQRAPAIQSRVARTAGLRLAHMVFGERSFPSMAVEGGGFGALLTDGDADALGALLHEIIASVRLSARARAYLIEGLKTGTSVAVQSIVCGKPRMQILPAKWCRAERDAAGRVVRLVVRYKSGNGDALTWYRREIGGGRDRVWQPVPIDRSGVEPAWDTLPLASDIPCPIVAVCWTACLAETVEEGVSDDGHALAEGMEAEVEALDMELSQLYRNALYNGEPQIARIGVDTGASMGSPGVTAGAPPSGFSWANTMTTAMGAVRGWVGGGQTATQKAPGKIWDIPVGGDVKLVESTGAGANIIAGAVTELRRTIADSLGVVLVDPQSIGKGDLSARALSLLFGPQLDTADNLRVEYGDALLCIVDQFFQLCAFVESVHLPSWAAARPALSRCWGMIDGMRTWIGPNVKLSWGEYFEPAWSDIDAAITAAEKAVGSRPVLSRRRAVTLLAPIVGTEDIDAEIADIAREEGESADAVHRTIAGLHEPTHAEAEAIAGESEPEAPAATAPTATGIDANAIKDQSAALNGAQVAAAQSIAQAVTAGALSRSQGIALLLISFPITRAQAEAVVGDAPTATGGAALSPFRPANPVAPTSEGDG